MIRKFLLFCIFISAGFFTYSQISVSIGISDERSGKSIVGASLFIPENNYSAISNEKGVFHISNLPEGRYTLCFSHLNYLPDTIRVSFKKNFNQNFEITLEPKVHNISTVTITSTRNDKGNKTPGSVQIIQKRQLEELPVLTLDDAFILFTGIIATRNYGIFNKTGDIVMRGLNRNIQSLVLYDGVPYSMFDGSSNIWNKVDMFNVEKLEVLKGPNSTLYGANAMSGVINIVSEKPTKPLEIKGKIGFGTYNTQHGLLKFSGFKEKNEKGWFWSTDGFYRKSNGYILTPDSLRKTSDTKTYLLEYNTRLKTGYYFDKNHFLEIHYEYSHDKRGTGSQFYEEDGSFNLYRDHFIRIGYHKVKTRSELHINGFFKIENYLRQNESVKSSGLYSFYNSQNKTQDIGIWLSYTKVLGKYNTITAGSDYKYGSSNAYDYYRTSIDTIENNGKMNFLGFFIQDEIVLLNNKLVIVPAVRFDLVNFYDGIFKIYSSTLATSHLLNNQAEYKSKQWYSLTPKIGLKYIFNPQYYLYSQFSTGFRPGNLSDLSRTGDVNKGFKIANPDLKPEKIYSIEIGAGLQTTKWLLIEPCLFYSKGVDFQYFVGTGDSVYTTGTNKKAVIKRINIGGVDIMGAEYKMTAKLRKNLNFVLVYNFNHSKISSFKTDTAYTNDLTGKSLIEVPEHSGAAALIFTSRYINLSITGHYIGSKWIDDDNSLKLKGYYLLDIKASKVFFNKVGVVLTIQNLLNNRYTDAKGLLSPGRFLSAEINFKF